MKDLESIKDEIKNLAEDKKSEMSANVYEYLYNMVQSIDKLEVEE